ncbi:tetratricopeptide repeat protein [Luteimonas marina]|uniref:Tetratricopeptide repeat protein n=1 Tax=Luteimonas marina TaxID=488485 RepID=A0A5C5TYM7_9GAMM|nr:tetratricopeptide repeat protein [Luteimonas marina]TWT18220.1 tetratricopeptide repeat protein [Luteimonas marina]
MDVIDPLPDWRALAALDDEALPLLGVALLIARDEYPDLDPRRYALQVQGHAAHLRDALDRESHLALKMRAINRYLFEEVGYAGNHDEYYDPRNSYLNEVFERRLGNPLSLALVQMAVAREVGLPLDGVSFPGHFLVRLPVDDGMLVMDPFNRGRPLDVDELRQRARAHMGGDAPDDDALSQILHPASNRAILVRVLRNLHGVYQERGDWERATRSADRVLSLAPDNPEALRDRGIGYLELGHLAGAREDLRQYLLRHPKAEDAAAVRLRLIEAGLGPARLH